MKKWKRNRKWRYKRMNTQLKFKVNALRTLASPYKKMKKKKQQRLKQFIIC